MRAEGAGQRWEARCKAAWPLPGQPLTPILSFWKLAGVAETETCSSASRVEGRGLARGPRGVCGREGDAECPAFGSDSGHTGSSGGDGRLPWGGGRRTLHTPRRAAGRSDGGLPKCRLSPGSHGLRNRPVDLRKWQEGTSLQDINRRLYLPLRA